MNRAKYLNLTTEQSKAYRINHRAAAEYFNLQKGYILHHKDISLVSTDINRYIEWRPEDLMVMTQSEHIKLHLSLDKENKTGLYSESNLKIISNRITEYNKSELCKQRTRDRQNKKVKCVETGIIYPSLKAAAKETNACHISDVLRGVRKVSGGYHWVHAD